MSSFFRVVFILFWTALMITSALVIMLLTFNRKIALVMARTMHGPGVLWGAGIKLKVEGKENFPRDQPFIFASNHQSHLDIPCLFTAIPVNLHFIAKKELKWVPFIGWFLAATGMIFLDRSNKKKAVESLDKAGVIIKKGKNVIVFPEGTRQISGKLGVFKKGSFMLSMKADIPIVPVSISGTEKVLPPNTLKVIPQEVTVRIGKPIAAVTKKEDIHQFIKEVRSTVEQMKE
ncbi:MAG: 1-acyl-sn-glycerol-3-phosphate acyltransferase [Cyclobacteriaceae bacterium]|nr:1-acyl-sn-glycerol-3-phosphate acyltransferase [Cyclobacteriaceae bacterium]